MWRAALLLAAIALSGQVRAQGFYGHLYEPDRLPLAEILGMEVVSPDGRRLGRITDLAFDRSTGALREVAVGAQRYPIEALLAGDKPRQVIVEPPILGAAAGATALLPLAGRTKPLILSRELGPPERILIDLREGRYSPR